MAFRFSHGIGAPDLGNGSETVVLIALQSLRTVDYKVDAKVPLWFPPIRWSTSGWTC